MQINGKVQGRVLAREKHTPTAHAWRQRVSICHSRGKLVIRQAVEVPPSRATAANELESLSRLSNIVPDTLAFESLVPGSKLAAASVSAATLRSVLVGESLGHKPYEVC